VPTQSAGSPDINLSGIPAIACEQGDFLFVGAQTPANPETGELAFHYEEMPPDLVACICTGMLMVDIPNERIAVQTWRILANLQIALGSTAFDRVVHQRFFLRDIRDVAALERVIVAVMGKVLPSTTIVEVASEGTNSGISVYADFIALSPTTTYARSSVSIPELDPLTEPFPLATRAGQYIFTTPIAGVDLDVGTVVSTFRQLDRDEQHLGDPPYTRQGESIAAQQVMVFRHIERILQSQGSSLAWQLRQNGWLRVGMREFGPASQVRKRLFSGGNTAPLTSVQVSGLRHLDAHFEYGVIALVPPQGKADHVRRLLDNPHGIASYYVGAASCGPYVMTAGEVPVDTSAPRVIQRFADLEGPARMLGYGRIDEPMPVVAQAHFVYSQLQKCVSSLGSSMRSVIHQTVFMTQPSDYLAVERVATLYFGATLPASTLIPILSTSPYSAAEIEIEVVALTHEANSAINGSTLATKN